MPYLPTRAQILADEDFIEWYIEATGQRIGYDTPIEARQYLRTLSPMQIMSHYNRYEELAPYMTDEPMPEDWDEFIAVYEAHQPTGQYPNVVDPEQAWANPDIRRLYDAWKVSGEYQPYPELVLGPPGTEREPYGPEPPSTPTFEEWFAEQHPGEPEIALLNDPDFMDWLMSTYPAGTSMEDIEAEMANWDDAFWGAVYAQYVNDTFDREAMLNDPGFIDWYLKTYTGAYGTTTDEELLAHLQEYNDAMLADAYKNYIRITGGAGTQVPMTEGVPSEPTNEDWIRYYREHPEWMEYEKAPSEGVREITYGGTPQEMTQARNELSDMTYWDFLKLPREEKERYASLQPSNEYVQRWTGALPQSPEEMWMPGDWASRRQLERTQVTTPQMRPWLVTQPGGSAQPAYPTTPKPLVNPQPQGGRPSNYNPYAWKKPEDLWW
jgi:hypothetical protein